MIEINITMIRIQTKKTFQLKTKKLVRIIRILIIKGLTDLKKIITTNIKMITINDSKM